MNTRPTAALLLLLVHPLAAGEFTVEARPFRVEHRFNAAVLPAAAPTLELDPETWSSFVVETLVDHGTAVKKGEVVVTFEREAYDRRLEDLERAVKSKEQAVARRQLDLAKLEEEQAIALETARRAKETAAEDLDHFKKVGRPAAETAVEKSLVAARFGLESAREELKQLQQMYEADDLTEDTEEIILKRQRIAVEMEEFQLADAERDAKRRLEAELPRQLETLERAAAQAAIAFEKVSGNLPRELAEARLAAEGAVAELEREKLELERLRKDGALLEWKSPADGICFHGGLDGDSWEYGELVKTLKVGGSVPTRQALVTVVEAGGPTRLRARVDPEVAVSLKPGEAVALRVPGGGGGPAATIGEVEGVTGLDGKCGATLAAKWPEGTAPKVGTTVECVRVASIQPEALAVPADALVATTDGGWAVEVKLADGKTETRAVERGPAGGKLVQIRSGLEPGQVVVTPE